MGNNGKSEAVQNPFTKQNATVSVVCKDDATCFAWNELTHLPVFHTHGASLANMSAGGITWYGNVNRVNTSLKPFNPPNYCPDRGVQPKYNATKGDLAKVCRRGWLE